MLWIMDWTEFIENLLLYQECMRNLFCTVFTCNCCYAIDSHIQYLLQNYQHIIVLQNTDLCITIRIMRAFIARVVVFMHLLVSPTLKSGFDAHVQTLCESYLCGPGHAPEGGHQSMKWIRSTRSNPIQIHRLRS